MPNEIIHVEVQRVEAKCKQSRGMYLEFLERCWVNSGRIEAEAYRKYVLGDFEHCNPDSFIIDEVT
jgi:hypothetical protein